MWGEGASGAPYLEMVRREVNWENRAQGQNVIWPKNYANLSKSVAVALSIAARLGAWGGKQGGSASKIQKAKVPSVPSTSIAMPPGYIIGHRTYGARPGSVLQRHGSVFRLVQCTYTSPYGHALGPGAGEHKAFPASDARWDLLGPS